MMPQNSDVLSFLRKILKDSGVGALWVPHGDLHQNEWVPDCFKRLQWLTGFSGSAGLAIVTLTKAVLFVDGRYTLQAPEQVDTALWDLSALKHSVIQSWIADNIPSGTSIAYDPWLMTVKEKASWQPWLQGQNMTLKALEPNPLDALWHDRSPLPQGPITVYPVHVSGEDGTSKRQRLGQKLKELSVDAALFTHLDSIAWLLNLRGQDVPVTPIFLSFASLDQNGHVHLWVDESKLTPEARASLQDVDIHRYDPHSIADHLKNFQSITLDPGITVDALDQKLKTLGIKVCHHEDLTVLPRALKNPVEQEAMRRTHIEDALALVRFFKWLETAWQGQKLTEIDVVNKLYDFRKMSVYFKGDSFRTIAATGPHGAVIHYSPTVESTRLLSKGDIFLLDSGGHYLGGTTDVTRTIALGTPTRWQQEAFTRVLKGYIRLSTVLFPEGTTGSQLDALARFDLWQQGQNYAHSTGHGVGSYLSVHEGPQSISGTPSYVPLQVGMVLSNEPGYYEQNAFGIRIESLMLVKPSSFKGFLEFETLTLAPIDLRLVALDLLNVQEKNWLQQYHQKIRETLLPLDPSLETFLGEEFFYLS